MASPPPTTWSAASATLESKPRSSGQWSVVGGQQPAAFFATPRPLPFSHFLLRQAVEHLRELVGRRPIDHISPARVRGFAKQQFSPAVSIRIHGINQFQLRGYVQMELIG